MEELELISGPEGWRVTLIMDPAASRLVGVHIYNPPLVAVAKTIARGQGRLEVSFTVAGNTPIEQQFEPGTDLRIELEPVEYSYFLGPRGVPVLRAADRASAVVSPCIGRYA